ncbi:hypothetical protein ACJX0J_039087, partial [Zea mays]
KNFKKKQKKDLQGKPILPAYLNQLGLQFGLILSIHHLNIVFIKVIILCFLYLMLRF